MAVVPTIEQVSESQNHLWDPLNERHLTFLRTKRGFIDTTLRESKIGYCPENDSITIPIFDADGKSILTVKYFRYNLETNEKSITTRGKVQLFGLHRLVSEYSRFGRVVITEGEFDALVLAQQGFLSVSGTGGAGTWRKEWNEYFRDKAVVICYDADEAGDRGSKKVAKELSSLAASVKVIRLFDNDASKDRKDVTDFFVKEGRTVDEFKSLIENSRSNAPKANVIRLSDSNRTPQPDTLSGEEDIVVTEDTLQNDISALSLSSKIEAQRNEIADKALQLLLMTGRFLKDKDGIVRFYSEKEHQVFPTDSEEFSDYVSLQTGINVASTNFSYVMGLIEVHGRKTGEVMDIHRFAYFDAANYTLYLNNSPQTYLRITPNAIARKHNGSDGIYFVSDPRAEPFDIDLTLGDQARRIAKRTLVETVNFDDEAMAVLSKQEQRVLYWNVILSLSLTSESRTKSILVFIGAAGSGKTCALRMVGTTLFGERFEVLSPSSDERDIVAAVSRRFLVVLDNMDTRSRFLDDLLARLATGIAFSRRKLFTDNVELEILPKAHLCITSREPQFNREDIADRLLIFRVHRFEGTSFKDEGSILAEIMVKRTQIITGLVLSLQRAIVNLKKRSASFKKTSFRMATTGLLLIRIADSPLKMKRILEKMTKVQTQFSGEGHPLAELICRWLVEHPEHSDEWFTTSELFFALKRFSSEYRLHFVHNSVRSLGMALVNQRRQLELRLKIDRDERKTNNLRRYRFESIQNPTI